ncbi:hypothetical protein BLNAU_13379 [Blattamonas nauphoetae]|uniref:Uncharacterized protein n=1 Tax=Blattamonas nauphoetae TaxID=2049346 RepID=A0ABQ9XNC5_9EUKA|nr:hypothetical protein BLNAU_13379 [Blattamonas nauphoetae]
MNLDELPTRCAIAESCGLVSILSGIVSSHSSIGLKCIASGLLALIQNALGSSEIQKTEHRHLKSQDKTSTIENQMSDMNERILELQTTVCNLATQMAEQFGRINERQLQFDSVLRRLDDRRKSDCLREYRFQRWSKTGADAVEIFDEDFLIKTGNTFTLRQRPENEIINFIPKTLFSPIITSDVAQLSFTITHSFLEFRYGAAYPHYVDTTTRSNLNICDDGIEGWEATYWIPDNFRANTGPPPRYTREVVLEADCRHGQRSLKRLVDAQVDAEFYINLPLPFRFALTLHHPSVSVTIHSLTFTAKPTLKGGTDPVDFME